MDKYNVYDTTVSFNNCDTEINNENRWDGSLPHYDFFNKTMNELGKIGFYVEKDKSVHKILRKDYYCGSYHGLEFKANRYPVGFMINFYQNIYHENPNGGYYDFDKLDKMPYIQKLVFKNTVRKLKVFFDNHGLIDNSEPILKTSDEKIKYDFVKKWHHKQTDMNFNLYELDGITSESYNSKDRDKKIIYNGQIKYFRDYSGYLMRGKVYHNINNMWWVIINKDEYTNVACFELFDLTDDDKRGRLAKHRLPKEYVDRKAQVMKSSTKELINELKRRKKLVS